MEELYTRVLRVQALLGGSNSPTSRSPEAVDWIMRVCVTGGADPCPRGGGVAYIEFARPLPPSVIKGLRYIKVEMLLVAPVIKVHK